MEKDIVDLLREKEQLEQKLAELRTKKNLSQIEEVIIEEVERELGIVISKINHY
jgi:transcriptional regulator with XRE-family HTH domain